MIYFFIDREIFSVTRSQGMRDSQQECVVLKTIVPNNYYLMPSNINTESDTIMWEWRRFPVTKQEPFLWLYAWVLADFFRRRGGGWNAFTLLDFTVFASTVSHEQWTLVDVLDFVAALKDEYLYDHGSETYSVTKEFVDLCYQVSPAGEKAA